MQLEQRVEQRELFAKPQVGTRTPSSTVRNIADSCMTARSAVSPSSRHHSAIAFSVLKQEVGIQVGAQRQQLAAFGLARVRDRPRLRGREPIFEPDVARQAEPTDDKHRSDTTTLAGAVSKVRPTRAPGRHDPDRQHHTGGDRA